MLRPPPEARTRCGSWPLFTGSRPAARWPRMSRSNVSFRLLDIPVGNQLRLHKGENKTPPACLGPTATTDCTANLRLVTVLCPMYSRSTEYKWARLEDSTGLPPPEWSGLEAVSHLSTRWLSPRNGHYHSLRVGNQPDRKAEIENRETIT